MRVIAVLALIACGTSSHDDASSSSGGASGGPPAAPRWIGVQGERLGPLPPPGSATSTTFATSDVCAQCHLAGDGAAVRDAAGRDVSAVGTWRASPMALATRDPYYLAAFSEELLQRPTLGLTVSDICTRCHAPEGSLELGATGKVPTLATLTTETTKEATFAREGVACTLCHQIQPDGLGTLASFGARFTIGDGRMLYGPYTDPKTDPMKLLVDYTPTYGAQIKESALCATCHTVITNPRDAAGNAGPNFPEQVPYLEWLASSFTTEPTPREKAASCQDCHMPAADQDGATIETAIARSPAGLQARKPFNRHLFAGANVQLSRSAAADPAWVGLALTKDDHDAQTSAAEAMLKTAAKLAIDGVTRSADGIELRVSVTNLTGHKLPTGYPSRRMFLHVRVGDVFESGRVDPFGRLVSRTGALVENALPTHHDVVDRDDLVAVWESIPVDASGKPAKRPLDAYRYAKDDRLLPAGYDATNKYALYTKPIGTDGDPDFGTSDVVKYRIPNVPAGAPITVELLFQTMRPSDVEAFADRPSPAARKLFDLVTAAPLAPVVMANLQITAP